MADEPDPPETKPAPRRRASRKTADAHAAPQPPARRKPGSRTVVDKVEDAVADAARAPVEALTNTATKAAKAIKPRSTNRATPRAPAKKDTTMSKHSSGTAAPKAGRGWGVAAIAGGLGAATTIALLSLRGSSKRAAGTAKAHQPDGTDSSASFAAGIADENTVPGGAIAPAATATGGAHQADGSDSTASFGAGIADEGTIPS